MFRYVNAVALFVLLIVLSAGGCGGWSSSFIDQPAIARDGAGGVIVAYSVADGRGHMDFCLHRMDRDGNTVWQPGDVHLGRGPKEEDGYIRLAVDDQGNSIVFWAAYLVGSNWSRILARVDAQGNILWARDVNCWIHDMGSDGAGGVLFATSVVTGNHDEGTASVVKFDSHGDFPWGKGGVAMPFTAVSGLSSGMRLIGDGEGGAILLQNHLGGSITAERISRAGELLWGQEGVFLSLEGGAKLAASDGAGGFLIGFGKVWVQRVDAEGRKLWCSGEGASALSHKGQREPMPQPQVRVISAGGDEVIVLWQEYPPFTTLYAQRINRQSNLRWGFQGVRAGHIAASRWADYRMVSDGVGGAVIVAEAYLDNAARIRAF